MNLTASYVWVTYHALLQSKGQHHELDPQLLAAMICQESAGNTYAIRPEPGFLKRYYQGLLALVRRTPSATDNHWFKYPDVFSCSFGLLQVMYPVALEVGVALRYPTELCNPEIGVEAGCRVLVRCRKQCAPADPSTQHVDWSRVLLRYNGGGDPTYPEKIQSWMNEVRLVVQGT